MKSLLLFLFLLAQSAPQWYANDNNKAWVQEQIVALKQQAKDKPKPLYQRMGIKPKVMVATAYEGSAISCGYWARFHRTFTGVRPRRGIVAVDPRVIPLHSLLYIEGYGYGLAEDVGGAIRGLHVDVFIPSLHEARQWGRKHVKVYILRKGNEDSSFGQLKKKTENVII